MTNYRHLKIGSAGTYLFFKGDSNMEWCKELYDDMRMREMFEKIPKGRTEDQVDFMEKLLHGMNGFLTYNMV